MLNKVMIDGDFVIKNVFMGQKKEQFTFVTLKGQKPFTLGVYNSFLLPKLTIIFHSPY